MHFKNDLCIDTFFSSLIITKVQRPNVKLSKVVPVSVSMYLFKVTFTIIFVQLSSKSAMYLPQDSAMFLGSLLPSAKAPSVTTLK